MRKSDEILAKIAKEKEEKRGELVRWAVTLIDTALEQMYLLSKTSYAFDMEIALQERFEKASAEPEVIKALEELDFTTQKSDVYPRLTFYLKQA